MASANGSSAEEDDEHDSDAPFHDDFDFAFAMASSSGSSAEDENEHAREDNVPDPDARLLGHDNNPGTVLAMAVMTSRGGSAEREGEHADLDDALLPGLHNDLALRCLAFMPPLHGESTIKSARDSIVTVPARNSFYSAMALINHRFRDLLLPRPHTLLQLRASLHVGDTLICLWRPNSVAIRLFDPHHCKSMHLTTQGIPRLPPRPAEFPNHRRVSHHHASSSYHSDTVEQEDERWEFDRFLFVNTQVLLIGFEGKFARTATCYRLNLLRASWEQGPPMCEPGRSLFATASCGNYAIVAGGCVHVPENSYTSHRRVLYSAEKYDADTNSWHYLPSMPAARQGGKGFFMDGKFYVLGGKGHFGTPISSGAVYDPASMSWETIQNMRPDTHDFTLAVGNNQLYALDRSTCCLLLYQKQKNTWVALGSLLEDNNWRQGELQVHEDGLLVVGDKLLVMADSKTSTGGSAKSETVVFSWHILPQPLLPRWHHMYSVKTPSWRKHFRDVLII